MVTIVGKIDLENDARKKVRLFKIKIIEILNKHKTKTFPLGMILHDISTIKNDVKKAFPKYNIPKGERRNENDKFDWHHFFEDNFSTEFEIEKDAKGINGKTSDILHYHSEKDTQKETIVENNITETKPIETEIIIQSEDSSLESKTENTTEPMQIDFSKDKIEEGMTKDKTIEPIATSETTSTSDSGTKKSNEKKEQTSKMSQKKINEHLKTLIEELNTGLYEKERSIRLNLLAILAGESTFMLGEPGTAKSLVARRISDAFEEPENKDEIKFFDYLMNQFSTPEEIFGPVSIQELKGDKYVRKTEKYLPKAQFAFLDEIWKANPAIQNALLTILNEKIFKNGVKTENVPLIGFMSASNELPEKGKGLDAIFDRFLVRILEKPISNADNFRSMISAGKNTQAKISKKLTKKIIDHISKKAECLEITDECFDVIESIRKALTNKNQSIEDESEKYIISDRRWKKIANLMRVSAYCNNRKKTDLMDASLIADCIWSTETQEHDAKIIVKETIENYGLKCDTNFANLESDYNKFKKKVDNTFFEEEKKGGDFKKELIEGIEYYIVKDEKEEKHKISVEHLKNYYSEDHYYYDSKRNDIRGKYENDKFISSNYDYSTRSYPIFTIERNPITKRLVRNSFFKTNKKECEKIVKKFNKTDYQPLLMRLENELKSINMQLKDCNEKLGDNIFADTNYYLPIITEKLTDSKVKLNDLIAKLEAQKERYDIY